MDIYFLCQRGENISTPPPLIYGSNKWSPSTPGSPLLLHLPTRCSMLTDDALRSSTENTHHLLQLLSLTTIFEFDELSNYIPTPHPTLPHLSPELGGATNQAAVVATKRLLWRTKAPSTGQKSSSFVCWIMNCFWTESQTGTVPSWEEISQLIINQIKARPHGSMSAQSFISGTVK